MQARTVLRQERKFLIHTEQYYRFSRQLKQMLKEDIHNGTDGYLVRSLYFDTMQDKDYQEKLSGIEYRRKIRMRLYSPDSPVAYLEMKQKQGANQRKRSLAVPKEDALEVMKGHYEVLLGYRDAFAAECYGIMKTQCYIPRVIVEYDRMAFICQENNTRITFDRNIRSSVMTGTLFAQDAKCVPALHPGAVVLEVKYDHFLLSYVKKALQTVNKSEVSVSKYVTARQASFRFLRGKYE